VTLRVTARDMSEGKNFATIEVQVPSAAVFTALPTIVSRLQPMLAEVNWGPRGSS
jgi:hypothetical protein